MTFSVYVDGVYNFVRDNIEMGEDKDMFIECLLGFMGEEKVKEFCEVWELEWEDGKIVKK
jgi:hypothetical protein